MDKSKSKDKVPHYLYGDLLIKREFGDLIVWFQIIKEAKSRSAEGIVLITEDGLSSFVYLIVTPSAAAALQMKRHVESHLANMLPSTQMKVGSGVAAVIGLLVGRIVLPAAPEKGAATTVTEAESSAEL